MGPRREANFFRYDDDHMDDLCGKPFGKVTAFSVECEMTLCLTSFYNFWGQDGLFIPIMIKEMKVGPQTSTWLEK